MGDFTASKEYLIASLEQTHQARIEYLTTLTLYHYAILLGSESNRLKDRASDNRVKSTHMQKKVMALALLRTVISHPSCWQGVRHRAISLLAKLESELPADVIASSKARSASRTLDDLIEEILEDT
ncbi:hypothetical protein KFU94_69420 [Chloroflexi bacterium TSY]|nr:hypothetical protein [Chloroflexi bacterium TSY]